MKIKQLLRQGISELNKYQIEEAILKARMLLEYELKMQRSSLSLHLEDEVLEENKQNFDQNIQKLIQGIPIQYITNYQCFYGLDFYVDSNVLIPQPDTEILVEKIIELAQKRKSKITILDMCTGSGAIAISVAKHTSAKVVALDINQEALKVAEKNALDNKVEIKILQSDMFENVDEKFDMIVSNPPYIETKTLEQLSKEVQNEPRLALDGGEDGLKFFRILANKAPNYLKRDGILAVEIGFNQKKEVMQMFEKCGFCDVTAQKDFGNYDRIVYGKWRK